MRRWLLGAAVLCGTIGGSALAYPVWSAESERPEGDLYQALVAAIPRDEPEQELDAVFEPFFQAEESLQERASVLEANGFDCKIEPSSLVEGNANLSCRRPVESQARCLGLRYFSYQTAEGQILEAIGDSYIAKTDIWGRCAY